MVASALGAARHQRARNPRKQAGFLAARLPSRRIVQGPGKVAGEFPARIAPCRQLPGVSWHGKVDGAGTLPLLRRAGYGLGDCFETGLAVASTRYRVPSTEKKPRSIQRGSEEKSRGRWNSKTAPQKLRVPRWCCVHSSQPVARVRPLLDLLRSVPCGVPRAIFAWAPGLPPTGKTYPTPRNSILPSTGLPVLLDQRFAIDPRLPSLSILQCGG